MSSVLVIGAAGGRLSSELLTSTPVGLIATLALPRSSGVTFRAAFGAALLVLLAILLAAQPFGPRPCGDRPPTT